MTPSERGGVRHRSLGMESSKAALRLTREVGRENLSMRALALELEALR